MILRSHLGLRSRFLLARAIHYRIPSRPSSRRATAMSAAQNVQRVVVRSVPAEDSLTIIVQVAGKQRFMNRPKSEAVEKPLLRLKMSAAPPEKRQKKQAAAAAAWRPGSPPPPVPVALYAGPTEASGQVPGAVSNEEAWQAGRLLRIGESSFLVVMNPPCVDKVLVHGLPLVGFPSLAMPTVQFTEASACSWRWFRSVKVAAAPASRGSKAEKDITWHQVEGAEAVYVPQEADEGCMLRVECHPPAASVELPSNGQTGKEVVALEAFVGEPATLVVGPVGRGPSQTAGEYRHPLTAAPLQVPQLRIVTYNLLADQYASSQRGKNKLFTYCPPRYLEPEYRKTLILQELLGFHADVLCLQEVDEKAFTHYFLPHLAAEGYEGVYTNKVGKVAEGCATFWLASRYQAAARLDLSMRKLFKNVSSPGSSHARFLPLLASSPQLVTALQRVGTIAQLVVLIPRVPASAADTADTSGAHHSSTVGESASTEAAGAGASECTDQGGSATGGEDGTGAVEDALCVVNTHLFYHPRAPHIRNIHVAAMMQEAAGLIAQTTQDMRLSRQPAVLFCGDLNSDLSDGIPGTLELLRRGQLPADFWDWRDGADFSFRGGGTAEEDAHAAAVLEKTIAAASAAAATVDVAAAADITQSSTDADCETTAEAMKEANSVPSDELDEEGQPLSGGGGQIGIIGLDLTIPFQLRSADELQTKFTNYVKGYTGALDYVWYEPDRLRVLREIPLPSEVEVMSFLPSQRFPSDHLSVVFDLEWVESSAARGADVGRTAGWMDGEVALPAEGPIKAIPVNAGIAARGLASEGVIVVPTDTLYGLAASAQSSAAMQRIYAIKQRSQDAPLAICVGDAHDVQKYADTEHLPAGLLRRLLPGATTVVLRRRGDAPLSPDLNPGVETIGIRVPQNGFVRDVCRAHGGAIALTSANLSGNTGPKDIAEFQDLWSQCAAVFDGGTIDAAGRAGSTIIDLSEAGYFRILRRGAEQAAAEYVLMLRAEFRLDQKK